MVLFMCVSLCISLLCSCFSVCSSPICAEMCPALALPPSCLLLSQGLGVWIGGLKSNVCFASALANEKARSKPESMAMESLQQCVGQFPPPQRDQQPIRML